MYIPLTTHLSFSSLKRRMFALRRLYLANDPTAPFLETSASMLGLDWRNLLLCPRVPTQDTGYVDPEHVQAAIETAFPGSYVFAACVLNGSVTLLANQRYAGTTHRLIYMYVHSYM